jgi:hypothetical protein
MPIKPENRHRYPADWPAISLAAKDRARWRCQHPGCMATQYSIGTWICWGGGPHEWRPIEGNRPASTARDNWFDLAGEGCDCYGNRWTYKAAREFVRAHWAPTDEDYPTIIVLTVAHLDHQPENCDPSNLSAMCQRHHLAYDQDHHRANAQATRRQRSGTRELF